jgi:ATP-dependent Clp protease protease subunit
MQNEFYKYATQHAGLNSNALDQYMRFTSLQASTLAPRASYINPSIIEERQLNVAQMDVFSRLMMDRIIFLGTEIDDYSANVVQAQLLFLASTESDKDITMYLNSPGGIVSGGLAIYDTMQYISCDVSTVVTGMAASMASVLLVAGTKGKRFALPHSRVMIHQPLGGTQGQASDMEIAVNEIKRLKAELYQILADHSGQTFEQIEKDCDRDHYMTAQEALEYGMIDKIFTRTK